jgi:hypothetical protein
MVSDLLRRFQLTAVLLVRCDAGRAEGMIANPRFDAGRLWITSLSLLLRTHRQNAWARKLSRHNWERFTKTWSVNQIRKF